MTTEQPGYITTIDDVEEAQRLLAQESTERQRVLDREHQRLTGEADQARRQAAAERLTELDETLIPANTARLEQAHATLADTLAADADPVLAALTAVLETRLTDHALRAEAQSMAATAGKVAAHDTVTLPPLDIIAVLVDALTRVATSRVPAPATLPERGQRLTHEQQMERERHRRSESIYISTWLHLPNETIATLDDDQRRAKLAEAQAAEQEAAEQRDKRLTHEDQLNRKRAAQRTGSLGGN